MRVYEFPQKLGVEGPIFSLEQQDSRIAMRDRASKIAFFTRLLEVVHASVATMNDCATLRQELFLVNEAKIVAGLQMEHTNRMLQLFFVAVAGPATTTRERNPDEQAPPMSNADEVNIESVLGLEHTQARPATAGRRALAESAEDDAKEAQDASYEDGKGNTLSQPQ